ncbi:Eukaryotic translation initiation factor 3 subunit B [Quillaja saponaria]|uniref:Eukaryotic translation initiation factor 3 subunit B n=1 Tax=Quillaja saponaria TaxID=32244 RepID=A0AAD7QDB7_QUISA|nr:Eukaryotic translation initiation factor 3 subunit B [Quillaja saponaria]
MAHHGDQHSISEQEPQNLFAVVRGNLCFEVYKYGTGTALFQPELICNFPFLDGSCVNWSPSGTYLAELRQEEIFVRGAAPSFCEIMRSSHSEGRQIDFSPGENYIVVNCGKRGEQYAAVQKVIDMKTGIAKKSFEGIAPISMGMLTPTVI